MACAGNPLGWRDCSDATRLKVVFQLRSSSVSISTSEGEGPHSTHTVTPAPPDEAEAVESSSLETSRNGTVGLFTGRKTGVSCRRIWLFWLVGANVFSIHCKCILSIGDMI